MLAIIITLLSPISGAHFNPVVTLGELFKNRIDARNAIAYIAAQFAGGFTGTVFANLMFDKPAIFQSHQERTSNNLFVSEIFATAILIMIIHLLVDQKRINLAPIIIPAWITTAFYATSSFVFANLERFLCWNYAALGLDLHDCTTNRATSRLNSCSSVIFKKIIK